MTFLGNFDAHPRINLANYLVRTGLLAEIGPFCSSSSARLARGTRVICRTVRGLEMGSVLTLLSPADDAAQETASGTLLRPASAEDELLWARIERNRHEAFGACCRWLEEKGLPATLIDAEMLFDGQSIFFYFLGPVPAEVTAVTTELGDLYGANVQLQQFADMVAEGCGPECGTEEGSGCGSGGCSTCAVATACRTSEDQAPPNPRQAARPQP